MSVYQAKLIKGSKIMNIFGDSYVILRISSSIIEKVKAEQESKAVFENELFFFDQMYRIVIAPFVSVWQIICK